MDSIKEWMAFIGRRNIAYVVFVSLLVPFGMLMEAAGLLQRSVLRFALKFRRLTAKSWILSRCYYPPRGHCVPGPANGEIWYFAYGANMHDSAFRVRRGIQPLEHRSGHIKGYQLRFNLDARTKGPHLQTCISTRRRRFGACSAASRGAS